MVTMTLVMHRLLVDSETQTPEMTVDLMHNVSQFWKQIALSQTGTFCRWPMILSSSMLRGPSM